MGGGGGGGGGGRLAVVSNCTTAVHVNLRVILSIPDITVQAVSLIKVHAIKKTRYPRNRPPIFLQHLY